MFFLLATACNSSQPDIWGAKSKRPRRSWHVQLRALQGDADICWRWLRPLWRFARWLCRYAQYWGSKNRLNSKNDNDLGRTIDSMSQAAHSKACRHGRRRLPCSVVERWWTSCGFGDGMVFIFKKINHAIHLPSQCMNVTGIIPKIVRCMNVGWILSQQ